MLRIVLLLIYFRQKYIEKCRHHVVTLVYHMSTDRTLINTDGALKKDISILQLLRHFLKSPLQSLHRFLHLKENKILRKSSFLRYISPTWKNLPLLSYLQLLCCLFLTSFPQRHADFPSLSKLLRLNLDVICDDVRVNSNNDHNNSEKAFLSYTLAKTPKTTGLPVEEVVLSK